MYITSVFNFGASDQYYKTLHTYTHTPSLTSRGVWGGGGWEERFDQESIGEEESPFVPRRVREGEGLVRL